MIIIMMTMSMKELEYMHMRVIFYLIIVIMMMMMKMMTTMMMMSVLEYSEYSSAGKACNAKATNQEAGILFHDGDNNDVVVVDDNDEETDDTD